VPYVAARTLEYLPQEYPPQPFHAPLSAADLAPIFAYVTEANQQQPLMNDNVQYMNSNETTVQPATVLAHLEDIYTPGDRLGSGKARTHRRQAPRTAGYPCMHDGCGKTFDRACELK
jgi:hypothetical protein